MVQYRRPADNVRVQVEQDRRLLNLELDARGSVMYTYSPAWDAATTNPSIGNGSLTGEYRRVGTLVMLNIRLVIGSTTNVGTGAWNFQVPFEVDPGYWIGSAAGYNDDPGEWWAGICMIEPTGDATKKVVAALGQATQRCRLDVPFSWDVDSSLSMSIWYNTTE